jgi:hypothetical protein
MTTLKQLDTAVKLEQIERMVNGSAVLRSNGDEMNTWSIGNVDGWLFQYERTNEDGQVYEHCFYEEELSQATIRGNAITLVDSNNDVFVIKCFTLVPFEG